MRRFREPVPVAPFVVWAERRLEEIARSVTELPAGGVSPTVTLAGQLGWGYESTVRFTRKTISSTAVAA